MTLQVRPDILVPPGMENHHSPFSGPPSEEDNIRGQHRGLVQSNEHSIDDEIVTHENQCLPQSPEPMELTEEEIFETKLFPGRPDVFGEPEPGPSRVVQRSSGVPETADAIYNRDSFLPRNNSLFPHPQPIAGPFPIGSPIFNAADRAFCKTSCFVQIFKNEFSRYEDDGVCNEIIDFFQRDGLNQLLILVRHFYNRLEFKLILL